MEKNDHDDKMTTARYERKSHELPVAFDQSSDKDAFVEDCKVVNVGLIVVNPLKSSPMYSNLSEKAAAEEGSEAQRKLYWFQVKCFQVYNRLHHLII